MATASLDWSQCPEVESIPGKVGGAWVLRDTRMPVSVIFENLEYGTTIEDIIENYDVTREQIQSVLEFAARSAAPPPNAARAGGMADARIVRQKRTIRSRPSPGETHRLQGRRVWLGPFGKRRASDRRQARRF